jgi:hypothetical protein
VGSQEYIEDEACDIGIKRKVFMEEGQRKYLFDDWDMGGDKLI